MASYVHTTRLIPQLLPNNWTDSSTGLLHMGLKAMSKENLALLGWFSVRYAQLESGADGYGEMYFDDAAQEYVVPSLPGKVMPPVIPEQVTRLQARLALIQVGLWETVVSYFANPDRDAAEIAFFEDAQTWRTDNTVLNAAMDQMGLSAQKDELFILAASL